MGSHLVEAPNFLLPLNPTSLAPSTPVVSPEWGGTPPTSSPVATLLIQGVPHPKCGVWGPNTPKLVLGVPPPQTWIMGFPSPQTWFLGGIWGVLGGFFPPFCFLKLFILSFCSAAVWGGPAAGTWGGPPKIPHVLLETALWRVPSLAGQTRVFGHTRVLGHMRVRS